MWRPGLSIGRVVGGRGGGGGGDVTSRRGRHVISNEKYALKCCISHDAEETFTRKPRFRNHYLRWTETADANATSDWFWFKGCKPRGKHRYHSQIKESTCGTLTDSIDNWINDTLGSFSFLLFYRLWCFPQPSIKRPKYQHKKRVPA